MFCKTCGKQIDNDSAFCRYCGCQTMFPAISAEKPVDCQENIGDKTNGWIVFLSVLVPLAGIILGVKYQKKGRKKSGITYLVVGIASAFLMLCVLGAFLIHNAFIEICQAIIDRLFYGKR